MDILDRFINKIAISNRLFNDTPCWIWTSGRASGGYGNFWDKPKTRRAHVWAYEYFIGQIPFGLEIDHLCRDRLCVNPLHLEPVSHAENMARSYNAIKSHCDNGHELTLDNLYERHRDGKRICKKCKSARNERYRNRHTKHESES